MVWSSRCHGPGELAGDRPRHEAIAGIPRPTSPGLLQPGISNRCHLRSRGRPCTHERRRRPPFGPTDIDKDMSDFSTIDFFRDESLISDPYPYFDFLRQQCPLRPESHHGVVMVTGYDEALAIYNDTTCFSSATSVTGPFPGFPVPLEGDDVSETIERYRDQIPFSDQLPT